MSIAWIKGRWQDARAPLVPADDRGILYGDGVFETFRSRDGRFFRLRSHLDRLQRGLDLLGIEAHNEVRTALHAMPEAFDRLDTRDVNFRLTVSRGSGWVHDGSDSGPLVMLLARAASPGAPRALRAVLSSIDRDESSPLSEVKSLNWLPSILALREAAALGYDEAILLNRSGSVAEASSSNVFWVNKGQLFTPSTECGALPGITREAVVEAAIAAGIVVQLGSYEPGSLSGAHCAFVTSASHGIRMLQSFGDRRYQMQDPQDVISLVSAGLRGLIELDSVPLEEETL